MVGPDAILADLHDRLRRYPADRYPVQHATFRFHLGSVLAAAGRLEEAEEALATAARLFLGRLPVEHAKAANALGAVLREQGRTEEAAALFRHAADRFRDAGKDLEEGAARFNLGLVLLDRGDVEEAIACFRRAADLLDPGRVPAQAAAVAREMGTALLRTAGPEEAVPYLERAVELARSAADGASLTVAANALGLAHLTAGRTLDAIRSLREAAAASPRGLRPRMYAMARANLALAFERSGDRDRAAIAARQALETPGAEPAVREQASAVLARVGPSRGGLGRVVASEPPDGRAALVREELARLADAAPPERAEGLREWVEALLAPNTGAVLADAFVHGLMELPPDQLEGILGALLDVLTGEGAEELQRLRDGLSRAMALLHPPQILRLRDTLNRLAAARGQEPAW